MTEHPPVEKKRSRRIYIYWGVALTPLLVAGIFCWLAVTRRPAERPEVGAVQAMRRYAEAQNAYHKTDWNGDGKYTYAKTLKELSDARLIPEEMAAASGPNGKPYNGYLYLELKTVGGVPINWVDDFALCAIPAKYGKDGYRTFVVATHETIFGFDQGPKTDFVRDHPQNPTAAGWGWDCPE